MARHLLRIQLALHHDLRGNPGVIGARLPQGVIALHAVVAGQRIHQGLVKTMPHVQRAGDVWWRQLNTKGWATITGSTGLEIARRFPFRVPARFNLLRFKTFGEFHDNSSFK